MPYTYEWPRPAVTVDVVLFTVRGPELAVLMIRRGRAPFRGSWALPGGFVDEHESLERAALRELEEETGVTGVHIQQLGAYGDPGRDPRGHTVSVAHWAFLHTAPRAVAADDAAEVQWMPLSTLALEAPPPSPKTRRGARATRGLATLAFDHARIIVDARHRLLDRVGRTTSFGSGLATLVPARFTLGELQHVYEIVLGHQVDRRNFRAKLHADSVIEPALGVRSGRHRPAQLYRFTSETRPTPPVAAKAEPKKKKRAH